MWGSLVLLRGNVHVPALLNAAALTTSLDKVSQPNTGMIDVQLTVSNVDLAVFTPPAVPEGFDAKPRDFPVHLATFVATISINHDFETQGVPAVPKRRTTLNQAVMQTSLNSMKHLCTFHNAELEVHIKSM